MNPAYKPAKAKILAALESIPGTRGTSPRDYKTALEEIKDEVESWFEASIDAAKDDIRRAEEE